MASKSGKGGLGRGLGSLLASTAGATDDAANIDQPKAGDSGRSPQVNAGTGATSSADGATPSVPASTAQFAYIPITSIKPNAKQPRQVFDPEALDELVHSIKEIGLLQPVVVRPINGDRYELIAGERRLRASTIAGEKTIAAIIRTTDDANMLRDALLENLHRANLNPLEEAAAYQQMLDDFGCTQEQLAARIGRSRPQVTNTLRLLRLPAGVQKRVAAGVLSAGHARALLSLNDDARAEALAARIVAEGLSVRSVEEIIASGAAVKPRKSGKKTSTTNRTHPDFAEVAQRLEDALDTTVTVSYGTGKAGASGTVSIHFADAEDLHRVVGLIVESR